MHHRRKTIVNYQCLLKQFSFFVVFISKASVLYFPKCSQTAVAQINKDFLLLALATRIALGTEVIPSGDSRMKKLGGPLRGQGNIRGGQHKYLRCMVIFHCFED